MSDGRGASGVPLRMERGPGGIVQLVLDRPEKRNALSRALVEALAAAFTDASRDPDARVVVVRGEGKDFCAGADLAELSAAGQDPDAALEDASRLGGLFVSMRRHPLPVVAAVHGRALAGGCGLALACDLVLAHEDAEFGFPEVALGFVPAMVMSLLRHRVPEGKAFELAVLGRRMSACEAIQAGLVNRILPSTDFEGGVEALAADLAALPPSAVRLTKQLFHELEGKSLEEGIARGAEVNVQARFTDAFREGARVFLRKPDG